MGRGGQDQPREAGSGRRRATALEGRDARLALEAAHAGLELSEQALDLLDGYIGDEIHDELNEWLRNGCPAGSHSDLLTIYRDGIDAALAAAPRLERDLIVFRGLSTAADRGGAGYLSCSIDPERARVFAGSSGRVLRLRIPAGTQLLSLSHLEGLYRYRHEEEVLLPRELELDGLLEG